MALATAYLRRTGQATPALEERAQKLLKTSVAKLQRYEVKNGGFSLWGRAPARLDLSAYALMVFFDLGKVEQVDPDVLGRTYRFLRKKRKPNGSWNDDFALTAYVVWAFKSAGHDPKKSIAYVTENLAAQTDPYALALAALALDSTDALARLKTAANDGWWTTKRSTLMRARGKSAAVETSGLALQALMASRDTSPLVRSGYRALMKCRAPNGTFGSTQATLQALRALLAAAPEGARAPAGKVTVRDADGKTVAEHAFDEGSLEPARLRLDAAGPLTIEATGRTGVRATLANRTWVPWEAGVAGGNRVKLTVTYPEGPVKIGQEFLVPVVVRNPSDKPAHVVTLEIGVPPGFDVAYQRTRGEYAQRVERGERTVVIYLDDLLPKTSREFRIPMAARYQLDVHTAPSKAYEYYTPEEATILPPTRVKTDG